MWKDPFIEELHIIREKHAKQFNGDRDAIFHDWLEKQQNSGRNYVSFPQQAKKVAEPSSRYHRSQINKDK